MPTAKSLTVEQPLLKSRIYKINLKIDLDLTLTLRSIQK